MKKIPLIFTICLLCFFGARAQSLFNNNLYTNNPYSINPSYAGTKEDLALRFQSAIYPSSDYGSPEFISVFMEAALYENLAVGGFFLKETFGSQEQIIGQGALAYRIGFTNESKLSFGMSLGFSNVRIQTEKLNLTSYVDRTDPVLALDDVSRSNLSLGYGMHYTISGFDVGFSLPNMLKGAGFEWKESNIVAGYSHFLRDAPFMIRPNVALFTRNTEGNVFDGSLQVEWNSKVWVQGGIRTNGSNHAGLGLNLPNIKMGYVFGWTKGNVSQLLSNKHELMLTFTFSRKHNIKLGSSRLAPESTAEENYRRMMERFDDLVVRYEHVSEEVVKKTAESGEQKEEMKKLSEDIRVLKGQLEDDDHTVVVRDELLSDKIEIKKGHYVIVATCRRLLCAEDVVKDFTGRGQQAEVVLNRGKGLYYITSGFYENYQEALDAMMQQRASGIEDAWVLVNDFEE